MLGGINIELNKIYFGNCLEVMKDIDNKSIDLILCDLPYGQTARNKWDIIIPFDELWMHYERIIKENGAICLFANGMFTADLMISNRKMWKYNLIWDKIMTTGFLNANRMPLRKHEDVLVFYKKQPTYNPQKFKGEKKSHSKGDKARDDISGSNYSKANMIDKSNEHGNMKFPTSIIIFGKIHPSLTIHPTQKPLELFEYLIKTYTNKNDIVLDNCIGSGTTAIACLNTNRQYIGIEKEEKYFNLANERINQYKYQKYIK